MELNWFYTPIAYKLVLCTIYCSFPLSGFFLLGLRPGIGPLRDDLGGNSVAARSLSEKERRSTLLDSLNSRGVGGIVPRLIALEEEERLGALTPPHWDEEKLHSPGGKEERLGVRVSASAPLITPLNPKGEKLATLDPSQGGRRNRPQALFSDRLSGTRRSSCRLQHSRRMKRAHGVIVSLHRGAPIGRLTPLHSLPPLTAPPK